MLMNNVCLGLYIINNNDYYLVWNVYSLELLHKFLIDNTLFFLEKVVVGFYNINFFNYQIMKFEIIFNLIITQTIYKN